jgi:hypothetical protein
MGKTSSWVRSNCRLARVFRCTGDDAVSVAMEASRVAWETREPVQLVVDGKPYEIGPDDVMFFHRGPRRG